MKIERLSENQIRCTLTKEDLENHQIRISELAYGTDKAKKLFRDMMQQAQIELGFEADNIPLMIEAIPISAESIILIITKVEDPEELDTRFSKFSPYKNSRADNIQFDGADSIIDIFQKLMEDRQKNAAPRKQEKSGGTPHSDTPAQEEAAVNLVRLYTFQSLDDVIAAARGLDGFYHGENTLYKDSDGLYQLVIHQSAYTPEEFNKVCNILSEYSRGRSFTLAGEAHLKEHEDVISTDAVQQLAQL